jgi:hypothetical protein
MKGLSQEQLQDALQQANYLPWPDTLFDDRDPILTFFGGNGPKKLDKGYKLSRLDMRVVGLIAYVLHCTEDESLPMYKAAVSALQLAKGERQIETKARQLYHEHMKSFNNPRAADVQPSATPLPSSSALPALRTPRALPAPLTLALGGGPAEPAQITKDIIVGPPRYPVGPAEPAQIMKDIIVGPPRTLAPRYLAVVAPFQVPLPRSTVILVYRSAYYLP